ncbi:MAG: DNA repair protein RecN [Proteobacteria bacterium]|nr:DNA repair protein RecN [Pseudomonadota bacterium]
MLQSLSIRDVVLIDRLDLGFRPGLSVLTGETGAGKSILLDALGLALGARGEGGLIRHGAERASVAASFAVGAAHPARALIAEQGLDAGDAAEPLILRRLLGRDGRSRAFINDQPVGVALLREVGASLVEIQGQLESHGLVDAATHRGLLDAFAGLGAEGEAARAAFRAWRAAAAARAAAEAEGAAARRDEEDLRHAVAELGRLAPNPGEEVELAGRRALMMASERLVEAMNAATAELARGDGVDGNLRAAARHLARALEKAPPEAAALIGPTIESLERAAEAAAEAGARLDRAAGAVELDPRRLEETEARLFALRAAARKHGCEVDALAGLRDELARRLAAIKDQGARLAGLTKAEAEARAAYVAAARTLSAARREAARRLDRAVARELPPLKLEKAVFRTGIGELDEGAWGEGGIDRVAFEIATNPGIPPGPLARIASGGELARLMLALKVVLAKASPVPTLVFDEVDAGIGGAPAAAVGERLVRLAGDVQVLVVTHSPQVAARGAHHWRIVKRIADGAARAEAEELDAAARREEIARMLAGARVTDEARAAAARLIAGDAGGRA